MATHTVPQHSPQLAKRSPLVEWVMRHSLAAFFLLTFSYSGLLMAPVLASARGWIPVHITGLPALFLQLLAIWGPTLSAFVLTAVIEGRAGVRVLFGRLLRWRVGVQWYAVVLLLWPAIYLAALFLLVLLGGSIPSTMRLTPWYTAPLAYLINFPLFFLLGGPLGEEAGWRGLALPRLLERHSAFFASLLVGMIWASWHLPLFWIPGTGSGSGLADFVWFFPLLSAWGVLLGWVYINTGSLLLCVLFHAAGNTLPSAVLPAGGHSPVKMLVVAVTWVVVLVVVLAAGPAHLSRRSGETRLATRAEGGHAGDANGYVDKRQR